MIEVLNRTVERFVSASPDAANGISRVLPDLFLYERSAPTEIEPTFYEPIACLALQGQKETTSGSNTRRFRAGELVTFSHAMPVLSRITMATKEKPYRALVLQIDLSIMRGFYDQLGERAFEPHSGSAIEVYQCEVSFIETLSRYFALLNDPIEARVLAPLIRKELHYRLLVAPQGRMLRKLLNLDSYASRIGAAITYIRRHYSQSLSVSHLAQIAGMSGSAFHAHFRAITETTPLQYQKELRLLEAHRLLKEEGMNVSSAAFEVGYESATQFSREYSRKFGATPSTVRQEWRRQSVSSLSKSVV